MRRWLYGMRPAASAWEEEYSAAIREKGWVKGKSSSTVFWHPKSDMRLVV